jgi:hypothetical protein
MNLRNISKGVIFINSGFVSERDLGLEKFNSLSNVLFFFHFGLSLLL